MPAARAASSREAPSSTSARASIRRAARASRHRAASRRSSTAPGSFRVTATVMAPPPIGHTADQPRRAPRGSGRDDASAIRAVGMTLWAPTPDPPARLAQATTGADGGCAVSVDQVPNGSILSLVATGGTASAGKQASNTPAIALLAVLGEKPPAHVVVNELTTVASVVTAAQFINGATLK